MPGVLYFCISVRPRHPTWRSGSTASHGDKATCHSCQAWRYRVGGACGPARRSRMAREGAQGICHRVQPVNEAMRHLRGRCCDRAHEKRCMFSMTFLSCMTRLVMRRHHGGRTLKRVGRSDSDERQCVATCQAGTYVLHYQTSRRLASLVLVCITL